MKLLNIGCGDNFHNDWINIDIVPVDSSIIKHNILKDIPFPDNSIDVIYHSHVLEHLHKSEGEKFMIECNRVLKPNGTIRIVLPNFEDIIKNYIEYLDKAIKGDKLAEANYDFTMIEMLDQIARTYNGGQLGDLYKKGVAVNSDFIYKRMGVKIRNTDISNYAPFKTNQEEVKRSAIYKFFRSIYRSIKNDNIKTMLLKVFLLKGYKYYELGKFRMSGEIHQWMYDRFSLTRLLEHSGYKNIKICSAFESRIDNWQSYHLDITKDGIVSKPDSLFIEANK